MAESMSIKHRGITDWMKNKEWYYVDVSPSNLSSTTAESVKNSRFIFVFLRKPVIRTHIRHDQDILEATLEDSGRLPHRRGPFCRGISLATEHGPCPVVSVCDSGELDDAGLAFGRSCADVPSPEEGLCL